MKRMAAFVGGFLLAAAMIAVTAQTDKKSSAPAAKKPPEKLVFKSALGNVTFDHAKHVEREKKDCKICHDKLFVQQAGAPLNFKANMHKTAEAKKTSCAACHVAGGKSFELKANCQKCHVKG